ncbi:hypothetical protein A2U01_0066468, partial [Trifolium medium]|nr:hypothetical protein [Trifolium medium]
EFGYGDIDNLPSRFVHDYVYHISYLESMLSREIASFALALAYALALLLLALKRT